MNCLKITSLFCLSLGVVVFGGCQPTNTHYTELQVSPTVKNNEVVIRNIIGAKKSSFPYVAKLSSTNSPLVAWAFRNDYNLDKFSLINFHTLSLPTSLKAVNISVYLGTVIEPKAEYIGQLKATKYGFELTYQSKADLTHFNRISLCGNQDDSVILSGSFIDQRPTPSIGD